MRNQLLRDSDVLSMSVGLELRTHWSIGKLWDTVKRIQQMRALQPGKKMLVDANTEIPRWILGGPSEAFGFPFEQWLSGPWFCYVHVIVASCDACRCGLGLESGVCLS